MYKVIIAGSRDFNNYRLVQLFTDFYLADHAIGNLEIVSGAARGADHLGELYAESRMIRLKKMPADWNTFGKSAGFRRNEEMARYADCCIAFGTAGPKEHET